MLWIIPNSLIVFPTVYWNFCNISKIMFEIRQMTLVTVWFRFMQVEPWWMLVSPPSLQLVHHSDFRLMTRSQKAIMSLTSRIFETLNHSAPKPIIYIVYLIWDSGSTLRFCEEIPIVQKLVHHSYFHLFHDQITKDDNESDFLRHSQCTKNQYFYKLLTQIFWGTNESWSWITVH